MKIDPAASAGNTMGSTTDRSVRPDPAPRSELASNSDCGTRSKPANTGITMYGNHMYASVMTVAVRPYPGVCPPVEPTERDRSGRAGCATRTP